MKKVKGAILLSLLGIFCISCGGKKEYGLNPKDPESVVIWNYYNGNQLIAFEDLVEEFNNTVGKKKGIVVSTDSKGSVSDLITAVNDAIDRKVGADEMPDIFQCYQDTAVEIDEKGILVNLDQYVSADEKAEYYDAYIEEGTFGADNGWKLFPVAKSTEVFVLNKTDWDEFAAETGASTEELATWEGCAGVAEEYYNWSHGKSLMGRDSFANYIIIGSKQLGTDLITIKDGKAVLQFDKNVMRRLWDNYYIPFIKGYYNQRGRYRSDDIKLGELIAMIASSSSANYYPTEVTPENATDSYQIECMILPLPNFEGTEPYAVQQGASMAVTKSNERKEYASVVFLEWFTESEQNMKFSIDSGYLPVKKADCTIKSYEAYLEGSNTEVTKVAEDTVRTCFQQMEKGKLYTLEGFHNAYVVRKIVAETMIHQAVEDRETIAANIEAGSPEEEAWEPYITEECFTKWYEDTKAQLEAAMESQD